jgi:serine/threonine protein kinase
MVSFSPGEVFRDLVIEARIGRGTFATVYRARDRLIDRTLALKVFRPAVTSGLDRDRVLREARMVGRIASPHVVALHRVHALEDGTWVFELEYVDGGPLSARLEGRQLPHGEVLRIARGVVCGLRAAHLHGVVHGDLKPENVLLGARGEIKLSDFGLGRWCDDVESFSSSSETRIRGTPLYMAPEVLRGETATRASDHWSLGVLLYRMAAGHPPFPTSDWDVFFHAVEHEDPRPLPADLPRPYVEIVERCLDREPARRPSGCRAVLHVLERSGTWEVRRRRRSPPVVA